MAIQLSVAVRNARLDAIETAIGVSAKVLVYTGSVPANCAASATGTLLATFTLASDWAGNASGGTKSFNNTPVTTTAVATGTAGYFRIVDSTGANCGEQGTITATGGGGDVTVDNTSINSGQSVNITSWTITDANA